MSSALPSRTVAERALWLPVAVIPTEGASTFPAWIVASGSVPGATHVVTSTAAHDAWACSCVGGDGCSHEWAVRAALDPAVRRQLRALVRGPRRMGRAEAAALLDRYDGVVLALATVPPSASIEKYDAARARRNAVAARIVTRLTGHADAEAGDE